MKRLVVAILMATAVWNPAVAQSLSANWAELTADDFQRALSAASYTCALPFGVVEKHGPSGPLGTDLINVRQTTALAAKLEYVLIFPDTTSARLRRLDISLERLHTAPGSSCSCYKKRWPRWRATAAGRW